MKFSGAVLVLLLTGVTMLASIYRDGFLTGRIDNIKLFVSYISICALFTTPFGERMQYGFSSKLSVKFLYGILAFSLLCLWLLILLNDTDYSDLVFFLGSGLNIILALTISLILGCIAMRKGPEAIRMLGPIFPVVNIFLVWCGVQSYILVVTLSYIATYILALIFYFLHGIKENPSEHPPKVGFKFKKSLFTHYLSFFIAYTLVFYNIEFSEDDNIILIRLPIYAYSIATILLPFISLQPLLYSKYLRYLCFCGCLVFVISFLFDYEIYIIELGMVILGSIFARKNSLSRP